MALVVLGANRSSPGVTTACLALAAAWARPGRQPLLVEADPDGGVLAARYELAARPNLTELAGRSRAGLRPHDAWDHAQTLPGGLPVLVAHPSAEQTQAALRTAAARLGEHFAMIERTDVLVDAGRLTPGSPVLPLLEWAALLLIVVRPRVDEMAALAQRLPNLRALAPIELVLVGRRPYGPAEVAETLGVEVAGVLADDTRASAVITDGSRRRWRPRRSALLQSTDAITRHLAARLDAIEATPVELGFSARSAEAETE